MSPRCRHNRSSRNKANISISMNTVAVSFDFLRCLMLRHVSLSAYAIVMHAFALMLFSLPPRRYCFDAVIVAAGYCLPPMLGMLMLPVCQPRLIFAITILIMPYASYAVSPRFATCRRLLSCHDADATMRDDESREARVVMIELRVTDINVT